MNQEGNPRNFLQESDTTKSHMDLTRAISEPMAKLIEFHNAFNRNIKLTYGAIAQLDAASRGIVRSPIILPNGGEPWGSSMRWRDSNEALREAAEFISGMGLARAASAFEDYVTGVTAELDRFEARVHPRRHEASKQKAEQSSNEDQPTQPSVSSSIRRLMTRLAVDETTMASDLTMVDFFSVARNCVVHRSNRASRKLAKLKASPEMATAMVTWPRRKGNWTIDVPDVSDGEAVAWLPRHAIMASSIYHRCSARLDQAVVAMLGSEGIVAMAGHWCLLADNRVPCPAKLNAPTMVRTQLQGRYHVRGAILTEIIDSLRTTGIWEDIQHSFNAHGLLKANHVKRRAKKLSSMKAT